MRLPVKWRARFLMFALGLVIGPVLFSGANAFELFFLDIRFFLASALRPDARSDEIAIIRMDRASAAALNVPYGTKWRQFHPTLFKILDEAGAVLIVFDASFVEEEKEWDTGLRESLVAAGNVMAGEDEPGTTTTALRGAFLQIGDLHFGSRGNKPRFVPFGRAGAQAPLSALAAEACAKRLGLPLWMRASPGHRDLWINFTMGPSYFPSFSYADVLRARDGRIGDPTHTPLSVFKDRVVLIGLDDPALGDRFVFPNAVAARLPGVLGQAFGIDAILHRREITEPPLWINGVAVAVLLGLYSFILEIRRRVPRVILTALLPVFFFIAELVLLSRTNTWIGYAPVLVSFLFAVAMHVVRARLALSTSLRRAVGFDPRLLEAFRRERQAKGGDVQKPVAILIADVRNYTLFVSGTDPAVVSRVMSEYFVAMERCITGNGGYVNMYVGDEIVAVFGFPLTADRAASRAVDAGVAMLAELSRLGGNAKDHGTPGIERIGIGIDTGLATFMEVGGSTKNQFDIIGDCINGASRIEHLTKELNRDLLISGETFDALQTDDRLSGSFELVKSVKIRGQGLRRIYGRI